ncbi:hypothetical protein ACLOJK_020215 [Asimina triloba]
MHHLPQQAAAVASSHSLASDHPTEDPSRPAEWRHCFDQDNDVATLDLPTGRQISRASVQRKKPIPFSPLQIGKPIVKAGEPPFRYRRWRETHLVAVSVEAGDFFLRSGKKSGSNNLWSAALLSAEITSAQSMVGHASSADPGRPINLHGCCRQTAFNPDCKNPARTIPANFVPVIDHKIRGCPTFTSIRGYLYQPCRICRAGHSIFMAAMPTTESRFQGVFRPLVQECPFHRVIPAHEFFLASPGSHFSSLSSRHLASNDGVHPNLSNGDIHLM